MKLAIHGDDMERQKATQYLENQEVGTSDGIFLNMKCISPTTIIVTHVLHAVIVGMQKHLHRADFECGHHVVLG